MQFDDGSHCHWTYTRGNYRSFGYWPTQDDAAHAAGVLAPGEDPPHVFQVHGTNCTCDDAKIKEPAA